MVERCLPHTSDDDDRRYRSLEEIEEAKSRDPLDILRRRLLGAGALTDYIDEELRMQAVQEINEATDFVEAAPYPDTKNFYEDVCEPAPGRSKIG